MLETPFRGKYVTSELLNEVIAAGRAAQDLRHKKEFHALEKKKDDFVTAGDLEVSRLVQAALKKLFPDIYIIDEEDKVPQDTDLSESPISAVIDDIDGTTNYYESYQNLSRSPDKQFKNAKYWGISIGLFTYGKPVGGIIYLPDLDELYYAEVGKGAYIINTIDKNLNNERVHVSNTATLADTVVSYDYPYAYDVDECEQTDRFIKGLGKIVKTSSRKGSQVAEIVQLLGYNREGHFKPSADLFFHLKTKPWDIAAALSIIKEAGGICMTATGKQYSLFGEHIIFCNGKLNLKRIFQLAKDSGVKENAMFHTGS